MKSLRKWSSPVRWNEWTNRNSIAPYIVGSYIFLWNNHPPINYISVSWSTKGTHTSIKLIRNTQGWDSIHIQSGGIEYRNRFPRVWGMRLTKFFVTITSFCLYERYLSIFAVCLFNQTDYRWISCNATIARNYKLLTYICALLGM